MKKKKQEVKKRMKKEGKKISRKKAILQVLIGILVLLVLVGLWNTFKSMPGLLSFEGQEYLVDEGDVDFLYDLTYYDESGELVYEQEIFDKIFELVDNAHDYILIDMFLMGRDEEGYRNLPVELKDGLIKKKKENPEISINFLTDEMNTRYYSYDHSEIREMRENGINIGFTNLAKLRDSNLFYSPFWRLFVQGFGNANYDCEDSFINPRGNYFCLRSILRMGNAKANHRKMIVTSQLNVDGNKEMVSLITSANPDEYGSGYSNMGLLFKNGPVKEIYDSEMSIAKFSKVDLEEYEISVVGDDSGDVSLQYLTEGKIKKNLLKEIENSGGGDEIDIAMFLLTERSVIKELIKASERGVKVKLVLDPSRNLFGRDSKGIPNCAAAMDLVEKSNGKIEIRWYESGSNQFHTKMVVIRKADGMVIVFLGSANLTRRNIKDYNVESDLKIVAGNKSDVMQEIYVYFERIWNNEDYEYTLGYDACSVSTMGYWSYRFQEASGFSSF